MLKSLWSGVSGLQAHQIAMDVESHNIANVNTIGFKYSRANFADMLSQVKRIATAPQGGLGGQNDLSVGLGTSISSTTKIFLQGSMQSTDKNTDMALQGDGFFILSGDRGITQKYSRSGDFVFDANGNLVDNNGMVVQGWLKEIKSSDDTCENEAMFTVVDDTGPISNIQIPPGLTLPAKKSSEITLKANLSNSSTVTNMECIYQLDDMPTHFDSTCCGTTSSFSSVKTLYNSSGKIVQVAEDFGVLFNDKGEAFNLSEDQGIWISYNAATIRDSFATTDTGGNFISSGSIKINGVSINYSGLSATDSYQTNLSKVIGIINQESRRTGVIASIDSTSTGIRFLNRNDDTDGPKKNIIIDTNGSGGFGSFTTTNSRITAFKYLYNENTTDSGSVPPSATNVTRKFTTTDDMREFMMFDANWVKDSGAIQAGLNYIAANPNLVGADAALYDSMSVTVVINQYGRFELTNKADLATGVNDSDSLTLAVTSYSDSSTGITSNVKFAQTFAAMSATVAEGGSVNVQTTAINAAKHASSIDVYDSLGTKHTIRFEFRKIDDAQWRWRAIVPEPGELTGHSVLKKNVFEGGTINFNNDGSLRGYNPPVLQYNPNNGAKTPQIIRLSFGSSSTYDGLTSVDAESTTSNIAQNGFAAGDLLGMRVDATGTILGSFSNGRTIALAKVAVAKFANNAGLQAEGNNLYATSANSGDPIVGGGGTGGRAEIAASTLEMSNVDLSRSLTQLITIQRGYQANSKTITTSDQLLNTLLGLKQ